MHHVVVSHVPWGYVMYTMGLVCVQHGIRLSAVRLRAPLHYVECRGRLHVGLGYLCHGFRLDVPWVRLHFLWG